MNSIHKVVVVVGPTASGKSAFAQNLALEKNGEILNADSQQFYTGFDIGTGKVLPQDRKVPHWLLDVCEPGQRMTAMEFARQADAIISKLLSAGKTPIIVGGTGLYLRALLEGLDSLPPRNAEIRVQLLERFNREGGKALHEQLKEIDTESAKKIHPNDSSRLIRYLEIYSITGKAPSQLMKNRHPQKLRYLVETYWLKPDREHLREKIAQRVRQMVEQGWLHEVKALLEKGIDPRRLENKPIGYAELAEVAEGFQPLEKVIEKIVQKTQQYAKRQDTFFRGLFESPSYQNEGCTLVVI